MKNASSALDVLTALKELGVQLAIDDFGTGYSSLTYLQRFPLDILKVDRSFVEELGVSVEGEEIVSAVINLAHALGLKVVAEGVETDAAAGGPPVVRVRSGPGLPVLQAPAGPGDRGLVRVATQRLISSVRPRPADPVLVRHLPGL